MPPGGTALAFGALLAGAVILDYGVKNAKAAFAGNPATTGTTAAPNATAVSRAGFPAAVDPLPGAAGSRLDQGIDATGTMFLSPWAGKVVYSSSHDSGWNGGGYIAIQSTQDASKVFYIAEGITPIVKIGDIVTAGQKIAYPVANPYNGIVGNIEAGLANPASPGQPLAQVVNNAASMVESMYQWLLSLGGPHATSTASAGHA